MQHRLISLKEALKLKKKSYRTELGAFLIEGKKLFQEAVESKLEIRQIWLTGSFQKQQVEFLQEINLRQYPFDLVSDHHAQLLADTETTPGFFALVSQPVQTIGDFAAKKLLVVLENIRDPGNLGTMIRTADWFGAEGLICIEGADPWGEKVIRASMGSVFRVPIMSVPRGLPVLKELQEKGFQILVTRPEAKSDLTSGQVEHIAVVMGNESNGTSPEIDQLANLTYSIPAFGGAESLNVAVSLGITLHDLSQRQNFQTLFKR